jgi:acetolactate synthase I/II/III large subunit
LRNDRYAVLDHEVKRHGLATLGLRGAAMFQLAAPTLEWVQLARGMGVPHTQVSPADQFSDSLEAAFTTEGPSLIEPMLPAPRSK